MVCKISHKKIIQFFFITLMLSSCGYYSFKGALPSNLKTIAVPLFDDNTAYPGVREDLTNKVVDAFVIDNTLKISDESRSDLILSGTILSIAQKASILSSGENVQEYQVVVSVKVKCEDVRNNKEMWSKTLSQYGIMSGEGTQEERDEAIAEAIEKLTEDIVNNTLGNW